MALSGILPLLPKSVQYVQLLTVRPHLYMNAAAPLYNQHNPHQQQGGQAFKLGMLPPGQHPRPPPLPPPPGTATGPEKQQFEVQGKIVQMFHPFASPQPSISKRLRLITD